MNVKDECYGLLEDCVGEVGDGVMCLVRSGWEGL